MSDMGELFREGLFFALAQPAPGCHPFAWIGILPRIPGPACFGVRDNHSTVLLSLSHLSCQAASAPSFVTQTMAEKTRFARTHAGHVSASGIIRAINTRVIPRLRQFHVPSERLVPSLRFCRAKLEHMRRDPQTTPKLIRKSIPMLGTDPPELLSQKARNWRSAVKKNL